ncbi:MAG: type IV secretory system conjugative DNA transfer family protein, partial [Oscillospiraceae bacterium]
LYLNTLPPHHPAIHSINISEVAPAKMRGSFYTSALSSLEMFSTNPYVYSMVQKTSFDLAKTATHKTAIFLIIPDEKSTYYPLASLFIYQHYQAIVEISKKYGNRLPIRTNYNLDEFGNINKIPDFAKQVTVGGGRGIRYNIFLQDFNQLDKIYGDKDGKTIRSNMETWVYLQSGSDESKKEFSEKLGKYTIKSPSVSSSSSGSGSSSYNYTGRELLTAEEIRKIQRPYQLVTSRNSPAIMYAPDISKTIMNKMLGLGSMEHNKKLIMHRDSRRPKRIVQMSDILLKPVEEYIPYGQGRTVPEMSEPKLLNNVKGEEE